jgi:hypothetical protein
VWICNLKIHSSNDWNYISSTQTCPYSWQTKMTHICRIIQNNSNCISTRQCRVLKSKNDNLFLFLVISCLFFILRVEVFDKQFCFLFTYIVPFCHFFHRDIYVINTFVCTYWLKSTRHCRVNMQLEMYKTYNYVSFISEAAWAVDSRCKHFLYMQFPLIREVLI